MANEDLEEKKRRKKQQEDAARAKSAAESSAATKRDEQRRSQAQQQRTQAQQRRQQQTTAQNQPPQASAEVQRGYDPRFDDPNYGKSSNKNGKRQEQPAQQRPQQQRPVNDELTVERPNTDAPPVSSGYQSPTVQTAQPEPYGPPERPEDSGWNPAQSWRRPEPRQQYFTPTTAPTTATTPPAGGLSSLKPLEEREQIAQQRQFAEEQGTLDQWSMAQQQMRNQAQQGPPEEQAPAQPGWGAWAADKLNQGADLIGSGASALQQSVSNVLPQGSWAQRDWGNFSQNVADSWNYDVGNPLTDFETPMDAAKNAVLESPAGQMLDERNEARWQSYDEQYQTPQTPGQALAQGAQYVRRLGGQAVDTLLQLPQEFIESNPTIGAAVGALTEGLTPEQQAAKDQKIDAAAQNILGGDFGAAIKTVMDVNIEQLSGMVSNLSSTWNKQRQIQQRIENSASPDAVLVNTLNWSGPTNMENALNAVEGRDAEQRQLTQQAAKAYYDAQNPDLPQEQRDAYALQAAQLQDAAQKAGNKSALQIMDEFTDWVRELGPAILLDPVEIVGPLAKIANITPEALRLGFAQGIIDSSSLETAVDLGKQLEKYAKVEDLKGIQANNIIDNIVPWRDTPLNRAMSGLGHWFSSTSQLLNGVDNQADAAKIINALVTNPAQLIDEGIQGLTSAPMMERAVDGMVKYGKAVVGNEYLVQNADILARAAPELAKVTGEVKVNGATQFDPRKLMTGIYTALQDAAIDIHGVRTTRNVAEQFLALQKGFLSFNYLGTRPANWVQNAANATMTTMVDGGWTWASNSQIMADLGKKNAISLDPRIAQAFQNVGDAIQDSTGRGIIEGVRQSAGNGTKSWWRKVNDAIYNIPYGTSPIGEQTFFLKNYGTNFQKAFAPEWKRVVTDGLAPKLAALGIDSTAISRVTDYLADIGVNGSREDVIRTAREFAQGYQVPFSLKELGVPEGALSGEAVSYVYDLMKNTPGMTADEFGAAMDDLFSAEQLSIAKMYNETPASMARHDWMDQTIKQDGGDFIDSAVATAKKAGIDPNRAQREATAVVKKRTEAENFAYEMLMDDFAASTPQAMGVATDTWAQIYNAKAEMRLLQNELYEKAAAANSPQGWNEYFAAVNNLWGDEYTKRLTGITDKARTDLNTLATGGEVAQRTSSWDWLEKMARLDDQAIMEARQLQPGSWKTDSATFEKVIQANRDFVDSYASRAYAASKRYPTNDSMDILLGAEKDNQRFGSQVAAAVADLRQQAETGAISWEKFYEQRNRLWYELADTQAARLNIATREIVESHAAQLMPSGLRWVDDFAGGEFQLQRIEDGVAYARRLDDSSIHKFDIGESKAVEQGGQVKDIPASGRPAVPQNVLDDYKKLQTGEYKDLVESTVQEIFEEAKAAVPPAPPRAAPRAPQSGYAASLPDPQQVRGAMADQLRQEAMSAREARTSMRAEWDRVASAEVGAPGIDGIIGGYRRNGVINFGDDFPYEDMLGKTIAGYQLDTQQDVERFLSEYARLSDLAKQAESVTGDMRKIDRMSVQELLDYRPEAFAGMDTAGITAAEAREFVYAFDGVEAPDDVYEQLTKMRELRDAAPYDIPKNGAVDWGGTQADKADALTAIQETSQVRRNTGGTWAPEFGELAAQQSELLNRAYGILRGSYDKIVNAPVAGQLTEAQSLRLMEELKRFMPEWDNTVTMSNDFAQRMAKFAMLDATDTKNLDKWISSFVPYHFFGTRTMKNWAERTLTRPDVAAIYYDLQNAVEGEAEGLNLPTRMQNSIPLWGNKRIASPLNKLFTYGLYSFNDFATPEEANNTAALMSETSQMLGFGLYPAIQFGIDAISGYKETGTLQGATDYATTRTNISSLMPTYKMMNYTWQAYTGESLPGGQNLTDPYRAGMEIAMMAERGEIEPRMVKWGRDIGFQNLNRVGPLPEEPAEARAVWEKGMQEAGYDRLQTVASAFLLGLGIYEVDPAEMALREGSAGYSNLGYDPLANPMGSTQAKDEFIEQNPTVAASWGNASLIPGNTDAERPGIGAATGDYWDQVQPQLDEQTATVDAFLIDNPGATWDEVNAIKDKYKEAILAINENFPTVGDDRILDGEGGNLPPKHRKGESPIEKSLTDIDTVLHYADKLPGKPVYPGEDASNEEKQAYYDAQDAYLNRQLDYVEKVLTKIALPQQQPGVVQPGMREGFEGQQLANDITGSHVVGQYAADLLRLYQKRFEGDIELMWSERIDLAREATSYHYDTRDQRAIEKFGSDITALVDSYVPASDPEGHAQWLADHGYEDYAKVTSYYDWRETALGGSFDTVARSAYPPEFVDMMQAYPGKEASKEEKKAFFEQAKSMGFSNEQVYQYWDMQSTYYGMREEGAVTQFGEGIMELVDSYVPKSQDPEGHAQWLKDHGASGDYERVQAYFNWVKNEDQAYIPTLQEAAGQARPWGSDRLPIGGEGATPPPMPGLDQFASDPGVQQDINSTFAPGGLMGPPLGPQGMGPPPEGQFFGGFGGGPGQAPPLPTQPVTPAQKIEAAYASGSISPEVYKHFMTTLAPESTQTSGEGGPSAGAATGAANDFWAKWLADYSGGGGGYRGGGGGGGGGIGVKPYQIRARLMDRGLLVEGPRVGFQAPRTYGPDAPYVGPDKIEGWRREKPWSRR